MTVLNFKVVSTRYAGNRYLYAVNLGVLLRIENRNTAVSVQLIQIDLKSFESPAIKPALLVGSNPSYVQHCSLTEIEGSAQPPLLQLRLNETRHSTPRSCFQSRSHSQSYHLLALDLVYLFSLVRSRSLSLLVSLSPREQLVADLKNVGSQRRRPPTEAPELIEVEDNSFAEQASSFSFGKSRLAQQSMNAC